MLQLAACIGQGHHAAKTIKVIVVDRVAVSQVDHTDRLVNTRTISVLRSSSFGRTTTQNTVLLRRMETYLRCST